MGDRSASDAHQRHIWRIGRLACGLTAVIGVMAAIAAVAWAQATPPVPVSPNPPLTVGCGALRIMLVLDESASIGPADVTLTRDAANAFVDGLNGTDTELAISAFAVNARNLITYQKVTGTTEPAFRSAVASFATSTPANPIPGGRFGTNWDAAFRLVRSDDDTEGPPPNLVVFMTDGNPNTFVLPNGTNQTPNESPAGWEAATPASITSANSVKDEGSRIFAIGLGTYLSAEAGSIDRLRWISGDSEFGTAAGQNPDFFTADYTADTSAAAFDHFRTILSTIISRLCGSSLVITKYVADVHGGPWRTAAGWDFTATLDTPHEWLKPDVGTRRSARETTNDQGVAEFHWLVPNGGHRAALGVTHETEKPGLRLVMTRCLLHRLGPDGVLVENEHPLGGSTTGIPGAELRSEEFMTCDVYNAPEKPGGGGGDETDVTEPADAPHLVVHKTMPAHATVGDHVPITITVHNVGHGAAKDVVVHETPPHGAKIVAVADGGSVETDGTVVWHIGHLAAGAKRTVHATLLFTKAGFILNTAVAEASNGDPDFSAAPETVRPAPSPPSPPPFTG